MYKSFYRTFLILCVNDIDILSMCMKKCHARNFLLLLNNCFSNLAILYGFCILILVFFIDHYCRGVSDKHCLLSFFSLKHGPRQANLVLIAYASSEGSGKPAHPRSLARTFAARSYKQ